MSLSSIHGSAAHDEHAWAHRSHSPGPSEGEVLQSQGASVRISKSTQYSQLARLSNARVPAFYHSAKATHRQKIASVALTAGVAFELFSRVPIPKDHRQQVSFVKSGGSAADELEGSVFANFFQLSQGNSAWSG